MNRLIHILLIPLLSFYDHGVAVPPSPAGRRRPCPAPFSPIGYLALHSIPHAQDALPLHQNAQSAAAPTQHWLDNSSFPPGSRHHPDLLEDQEGTVLPPGFCRYKAEDDRMCVTMCPSVQPPSRTSSRNQMEEGAGAAAHRDPPLRNNFRPSSTTEPREPIVILRGRDWRQSRSYKRRPNRVRQPPDAPTHPLHTPSHKRTATRIWSRQRRPPTLGSATRAVARCRWIRQQQEYNTMET